jgi:hypothetical protein
LFSLPFLICSYIFAKYACDRVLQEADKTDTAVCFKFHRFFTRQDFKIVTLRNLCKTDDKEANVDLNMKAIKAFV